MLRYEMICPHRSCSIDCKRITQNFQAFVRYITLLFSKNFARDGYKSVQRSINCKIYWLFFFKYWKSRERRLVNHRLSVILVFVKKKNRDIRRELFHDNYGDINNQNFDQRYLPDNLRLVCPLDPVNASRSVEAAESTPPCSNQLNQPN